MRWKGSLTVLDKLIFILSFLTYMLEGLLNEIIFLVETDDGIAYYSGHAMGIHGKTGFLADFSKVEVNLSVPDGKILTLDSIKYRYSGGQNIPPVNLIEFLGMAAGMERGFKYLVTSSKGSPLPAAAFNFLESLTIGTGHNLPSGEENVQYTGLELRAYSR